MKPDHLPAEHGAAWVGQDALGRLNPRGDTTTLKPDDMEHTRRRGGGVFPKASVAMWCSQGCCSAR